MCLQFDLTNAYASQSSICPIFAIWIALSACKLCKAIAKLMQKSITSTGYTINRYSNWICMLIRLTEWENIHSYDSYPCIYAWLCSMFWIISERLKIPYNTAKFASVENSHGLNFHIMHHSLRLFGLTRNSCCQKILSLIIQILIISLSLASLALSTTILVSMMTRFQTAVLITFSVSLWNNKFMSTNVKSASLCFGTRCGAHFLPLRLSE